MPNKLQKILEIRSEVINNLRQVFDPEIPCNVWDLGLIYGVDVQLLENSLLENLNSSAQSLSSKSSNQTDSKPNNSLDFVEAVEKYKVVIIMTLTSPNCPAIESLPNEIKNAALKVDLVSSCEVEITWEPAWSYALIPEEIRLELNL